MNPVLLKPKGDFTSNVIIQGKSIGDMNFYDYQHKYHDDAFNAIKESFNILSEEYDIIVIEEQVLLQKSICEIRILQIWKLPILLMQMLS